MAFRIIKNRKNLSAHVLFTSNSTLTIAGNSSTSDIATGDEVITGCSITRAWCGSSSGNGAFWEVKRGANTVAVLDSTAFMDYAGNGVTLDLDNTATLVANINGTVLNATLILELKKISNGVSGPIPTANSDYFKG